jgi:hypothetical protein
MTCSDSADLWPTVIRCVVQCGLLSKCDEDAASWRRGSCVEGIQGLESVTSQGVHGDLLIHVESQVLFLSCFFS